MVVTAETKVWINQKYIEWRNRQPKGDDTVSAFAEELGVSRNTLNNWMNRGKTPDAESVVKLAGLGIEIYDLLGIPRPDPMLRVVIENWGRLPDEVRQEIADAVHRAEARGVTGKSHTGVAPATRRGKDGN